MKIAHEAPVSLFHTVQQNTDFDYALVHLFADHPRYYRAFECAVEAGREVILDNSIFELGEAYNSDEFIKWVDKLQPSAYIVPDVLDDGRKTIESFKAFMQKPGVDKHKSLKIGVVQGKSFAEIVECYRFMSVHADMIAISFDMKIFEHIGIGTTKLDRQSSGRPLLISMLYAAGVWNVNKQHHLLGCSKVKEFINYRDVYRLLWNSIRSVDTSNPVMAGIKGIRYNGTYGIEIKPTDKMCDLIDEDIEDLARCNAVQYNIKMFREAIDNINIFYAR